MSCIYKAVNVINGKVYIGKTNNLHRRIIEHKSHAYKDGGKFHSDILQFGFDNFDFEVIEDVTDDIADEKEIFYIKKARDEMGEEMVYNVTKGGVGGQTHDICGVNNPMYGVPMSEERRSHLSEVLTGKKKPAGFGEKISAVLSGKKKSPEHVAKKSHKVSVINEDTLEIRNFISKSQLERELHCNFATLKNGGRTKSGWRIYNK